MPLLSLSLTELKPRYDVVIIGSGYGGSIAPSVLARAHGANGKSPSACLLERGKEIPMGQFPAIGPDRPAVVTSLLRWLPFKELAMRTALFMLLCAVASGCAMGSSYIYEQDTRGGILTLEGSEKDALKDARKKMAAHCGVGNYQVVRRETVVVGHEQYTDMNTGYVETGERQREEATDTETQEGTEYGYDEATDTTVVNEPTGTGDETHAETSTSGGGYQSTGGSSSSTTSEGERERRERQASRSTVSGTREVRERRLQYVCGQGA